MGWLYQYHRPQGGTNKWMHKQLTMENDQVKQTCLDAATVGLTEGYAAVEIIRKDTGERKVIAAVYMFNFAEARDGTCFGYKDMDETMGPCQVRCPKRILKLLTPPENEYARKWRAAVADYHAGRASKRGLRKGSRIRLSDPMQFTNGCSYADFEVMNAKRGHFWAIDASGAKTARVRITRWRERDFTITNRA